MIVCVEDEVADEWDPGTPPSPLWLPLSAECNCLCFGEADASRKGCAREATGAYIPAGVVGASVDVVVVAMAAAYSGGIHIPPTTTN